MSGLWLEPSVAPEAEALVVGPLRLSRSELAARAEALAAGLERAGVRPGEVVAALLANSLEFVVSLHALDRLGVILLPLNTRFTPRELAHPLRDSGTRWLLHDDGMAPLLYRPIRPETGELDPASRGNYQAGWTAEQGAEFVPETAVIGRDGLPISLDKDTMLAYMAAEVRQLRKDVTALGGPVRQKRSAIHRQAELELLAAEPARIAAMREAMPPVRSRKPTHRPDGKPL